MLDEIERDAERLWRHVHPAHLQSGGGVGDLVADQVVGALGSWRFVILQTSAVLCWIALNLAAYALRWDPYPFILLNLVFGAQAAYAAPLVLKSQNRAAVVDRARAENAYAQAAETHDLAREIDRMQREQMTILAAMSARVAPAPAQENA